MFTVCQSEQIEQTCGRRVASSRLPPITKLRLGLELPGQRTWDRMFFCCCIFSFFSSSFPSPCLSLFFCLCFQRCVSSSRSNNAGQRTTDHMFHEHTDCSRQGEESSFVSDLMFTLRFSRSVNFFCHSWLFIWQPDFHWHTHLWFRGNGWFCAVGRCERGKQLCLRLSGSSTQRTGSGQPTNQPTDRHTKKPTKAAHAS